MDDGIYRAGNNMLLEMKRETSIAQNIAGSAVPGYKREFVVSSPFQSVYSSEFGNSKMGDLCGSNGGSIRYDFTDGVLKQTNRRLDFAFDSYTKDSLDVSVKNSQLFFQVQAPDGKTLLTRNGCFLLDKDRNLTTAEGYKIINENGNPITLGSDDKISNICVTSDGQVKVEDRSVTPTVINNYGFIQLARVANPQALERFSANYFKAPDNGTANVSPADPTLFNMKNGYYEEANTSPINEMTAMIDSVRTYEFQAKIVRAVQDAYKQENTKLS